MTSRAPDGHDLLIGTTPTIGTVPAGSTGCAQRGRVRRGVPATRDLETTLWVLLGLAGAGLAVAALIPAREVAVAALVAATVTLAAAAATSRAVQALSPAVLRSSARRKRASIRAAVIGDVGSAYQLRAELVRAEVSSLQVVGAVSPGPITTTTGSTLRLGALEELARIVREHRIDILLIGPGVDGSAVAGAVMRSCEGHPVRLCELSRVYEEVFGRVALTAVDDAWAKYVLHPRFRDRRSQRLLDLLLAGVLALVFLPLIGLLALLVRRDGGPALFRQRRTGYDGRTFVMRKLRTMRWEGEDVPAGWTAEDDARVTRLGGILRRLHLDELPQLLNVLRGEMSLVGPRPEQPAIVARLAEAQPLWRGRHRHRPGLTGWAQIHCGYGGTDQGSSWKLAHDLYYLRNRSLALDIAILARTAVMLVAPRRVTLPGTPFVVPRAPASLASPIESAPPPAVRRFERPRRPAGASQPRALVTGGAGFIGSHLVDALLEAGYDVTALDDLSSGRVDNLAAALGDGARLIEADVTATDAVRRCLADARPDVVFHLAAQIDVMRAVSAPMADAATNVTGTLAVLEAARACGTRRFVLASSGGAIYGDAAVVPTPEEAPPAPISPYGAAKEAAEQYAALYGRLYGISTVSLRLANVYGPRQGISGEGGVIARYCRARVNGTAATVYGDGLQTRDYVYVTDVAAAFVTAARSTAIGAVNIGTGTETTVLDLVQQLGLRSEFRAVRAGEVRRSSLDPRSAAERLPWRAHTALADGLTETLAFSEGLADGTPIAV